MAMYKYQRAKKTSLQINESREGETIEQKIERVVNNKEPISDGAPIEYTERSEGVRPGYNIRTDRFEVAVEAMDKVTRTHTAKREERAKEKEAKIIQLNEEKNGKTESTQGSSE